MGSEATKGSLRNFFRYFLVIGIVLVALLMAANILIRQPSVQGRILQAFSAATGYEISFEKIYISLRGGFSLHAINVGVYRPGEGRLDIPEIYLSIDPRALLRRRLTISSATLIQPVLKTDFEAKGGVGDLRSLAAVTLSFFSKNFTDSLPEVSFKNARIDIKGYSGSFEKMDLTLRAEDEKRLSLLAGGALISEGAKATYLRLKATVTRDTIGTPFHSFDAIIESAGLPEDLLQFNGIRLLEERKAVLKLSLKGSAASSIQVYGSLEAVRLLISLAGESELVDLPSVKAEFTASLNQKEILISPLRVSAGKVRTEGELRIELDEKGSPYLQLNLSAPPTALGPAKEIVPSFLYPSLVKDKILPLLTEGTVGLEGLTLKGNIEAITHLERPENWDLLKVKLFWNEINVMKNPLSPQAERCSGRLSLQAGNLVISDVGGVFGKSNVENASLKVGGIYGGHREYGFSGSVAIDLRDTPSLRDTSWMPEKAKDILSLFSQERGSFEVSLRGTGGANGINLEGAEILVKDCLLRHTSFPFAAELLSGAMHLGLKGSGSFTLAGVVAGSSVDLEGSFLDFGRGMDARGSFAVNAPQLLNAFGIRAPLILKAKNMLPGTLSLKVDNVGHQIDASFQLGGLSMRTNGFSLKIPPSDSRLDLSVEWRPGDFVDIREARITSRRSNLTIRSSTNLKHPSRGIVRLLSNGLFLEDFGLEIEGIGTPSCKLGFELELPLSAFFSKRGTNEEVSLKGESTLDFLLPAILGRLEISGLSLPSGILPFPVQKADATLHLFRDRVLIKEAFLKSEESVFQAEGTINRRLPLEGSLLIKSPFLKLSEILPTGIGGPDGLIWLKGLLHEGLLEIEMDVAKGLWKDFVFGPAIGYFAITGTDVFIDKVEGLLPFGNTSITGVVTPYSKPAISLLGSLSAGTEHLSGLLDLLGLERDYLEGTFSLSAELATQGDNLEELICHLSGAVDLEVSKGYLRKSHVLLTILNILSVEKFFRRPPSDLAEKGLYFEGIQGAFVVENGIVSTEDFIMQSPVINLSATGTLDLSTLSVRAEMAAQPFGLVDSIASRIPLLGYILTGKDGTFIIYYFSVEGDVRRPSVSYIPFKNIGRGTLNVLHRLLLTPGRIAKKIGRMAEGVGKGPALSPAEEPERAKPHP